MHGLQTGTARVPSVVTASTRSRDRLRLLAEAIEAEIVPRLVAGHEHGDSAQAPLAADGQALAFAPIPQAAMALAALVLREDSAPARAYVGEAVAQRGLETVCLDLLAPAARHLGDLWVEDICSFTDVTIGLMRLQSTLLAIAVPVAPVSAASQRRTALLAVAPGDQHSFGLTMVAGSLQRAGWAVTQLHDHAPGALEAALRSGWYGILGLSAGSAPKLQALAPMLPRLRSVSRNPDLGILVGGPLFIADPGLAAAIGADSTAADGPHAVQMAEALIAPHKASRVAEGSGNRSWQQVEGGPRKGPAMKG
jgi:methanogenic corrinoid protein MtbC1